MTSNTNRILSVLHAVKTPAIRNVLIFGISGAFALQALLLIYSLAVEGLPRHDEYNFIPMVTTYVEGGAFWESPGFQKYGGYIMIVPHLIMLSDVYLFSWSFTFQMYLAWGFLATSVVLLWLMFRRHDRRLEWLLIPVSAVVFNPLGYGLFLWGHAASLWTLTFLGFIACIYCLDRVSESRRYMIPAVISGGVISFSSLPGAAIWPIGLAGLLQFGTMGRMPVVIWIASASAALALLAVVYRLWESRSIAKIFGGGGAESDPVSNAAATNSMIDVLEETSSLDLVSYILRLVSNGSTMNHDTAQIALGAAMLVTILVLPIPYLYSGRIRLRRIMPFIQLLLVSLAFGVMTFIGRPDTAPDYSYHILRGHFAEIAFLSVLTMFLIVFLKTRHTRKAVLAVVLPAIVLLAVFAAGVGVSYSTGYHAAAVYSNHQQMDMQCVMDPDSLGADAFLCMDVHTYPYRGMQERPLEEYVAAMKDARIGPYRDDHPAPEHTLLQHENWQSMRDGLAVRGSVDNVFIYALTGNVLDGSRIVIDLDGGIPPSEYPRFMPDTDGHPAARTLQVHAAEDPKDTVHRIPKGEFDTYLRANIVAYGWIPSDESFSPDGVYLFVGDEIIRRAVYGYATYDTRGQSGDQTHYGYRVMADISSLDVGCHDVAVRVTHGDQYYRILAVTLCIEP